MALQAKNGFERVAIKRKDMQQKPSEALKPKTFTIRLFRMNLARPGVSYAESARILEPLRQPLWKGDSL